MTDLQGLSFDELIQVRNSVGTKTFSKMYKREESDNEFENPDQESTDQDSTDELEESEAEEAPKKRKIQRRADKNMPQEITSKKQVSRKRTIIEKGKSKARDPRFEPLSGHLNQGLFEESYQFVKELQQKELELLKKELKTEKDPERIRKLQDTLQKMYSRQNAAKNKAQTQKVKKEFEKKEKELVKQGKKPYFAKKSVLKQQVLVQKFNSLASSERSKVIEKKRKRNAAKEHVHIPRTRRN